MGYFILVERNSRKIDAIAESMSYFTEEVGYRFIPAEEAIVARNPYDLYRVSFDRVYRSNLSVGSKLGRAIPNRRKQVPLGHAIWPGNEVQDASQPLPQGGAT
jgi:hypothetical protein